MSVIQMVCVVMMSARMEEFVYVMMRSYLLIVTVWKALLANTVPNQSHNVMVGRLLRCIFSKSDVDQT